MFDRREPISFHQGHELLLSLEKAGFETEDLQKIIQSNDNRLAKTILDTLKFGRLSRKARDSGKFEFNDEQIVKGRRYFEVHQNFRPDNPAGVKFGYMEDISDFNPREGKSPSRLVQSYYFQSGTVLNQMIDLFEGGYEFTFWHIWQFLLKQPNGEDGMLDNTWNSNVFFVPHPNGELNIIMINWDSNDHTWRLYRIKRDDPGWRDGQGWDYGLVFVNYPLN